MLVAEIAQLGERQTEDLKVPGSNPESSHELWIIPGLGRNFSFFSVTWPFVGGILICVIHFQPRPQGALPWLRPGDELYLRQQNQPVVVNKSFFPAPSSPRIKQKYKYKKTAIIFKQIFKKLFCYYGFKTLLLSPLRQDYLHPLFWWHNLFALVHKIVNFYQNMKFKREKF